MIENALEKMKADASALSSESTDNQNVSGNAAATGNDRTDLDGFPTPKKLTWKIDDGINQAITTAQIDMDRFLLSPEFSLSSDVQCHTLFTLDLSGFKIIN